MLTREPVQIHHRRSMTEPRKVRIHAANGGKCWMCGFAVDVTGPSVEYDHRVSLGLGGHDVDENLSPLHADPCHKLKTRADKASQAKAKRLANPKPPKGTIKSRGFDKGHRKLTSRNDLRKRTR